MVASQRSLVTKVYQGCILSPLSFALASHPAECWTVCKQA